MKLNSSANLCTVMGVRAVHNYERFSNDFNNQSLGLFKFCR
jgi:hypothetical protein